VAYFLVAAMSMADDSIDAVIDRINDDQDNNQIIVEEIYSGAANGKPPYFQPTIAAANGGDTTVSSACVSNSCGRADDDLLVNAQRTRISSKILEFFADQDIHLPMSLLLFQPDITVTTCGAFIVKAGRETGCLCLRDPEVNWTVETNDDSIEVSCAFKSRLLIARRENLLFADAVSVVAYHGGGGTAFVDAKTHRPVQNHVPRPDYGIFVLPERLSWTPPHNIIRKSGFDHPDLVSGNSQPYYTCHHLGRHAYRFTESSDHFFLPTHFVADPLGDKSAMKMAPVNQLLYQANFEFCQEIGKDGQTNWEMEEGVTPFGPRITTRTALVLSGEADAFDTVPELGLVSSIAALRQ
jgi:hypothetical protein